MAGQNGVKNPQRYLAAALRDDYRPGQAAAAPGSAVVSPRAARLGRVRDLAAARTPTQRDADRRLFLSRIADAGARADFERHGWMSALNAQGIFDFWETLVPGAFDDV
jgi:hypothetical protein